MVGMRRNDPTGIPTEPVPTALSGSLRVIADEPVAQATAVRPARPDAHRRRVGLHTVILFRDAAASARTTADHIDLMAVTMDRTTAAERPESPAPSGGPDDF